MARKQKMKKEGDNLERGKIRISYGKR